MTSVQAAPNPKITKAASGCPGRPSKRYRAEKVRLKARALHPKTSSLRIGSLA
jgi:hypothetical protein